MPAQPPAQEPELITPEVALKTRNAAIKTARDEYRDAITAARLKRDTALAKADIAYLKAVKL